MDLCPPSGDWEGFYSQYGEKYYFKMHLKFYSGSSQTILGFCQDGDNDMGLGFADIVGNWSQNEDEDNHNQLSTIKIKFTKKYRGQHKVPYTGVCEQQNMNKIYGFYFEDEDNVFEMFFSNSLKETEVKDESAVELYGNISNNYSKGEHMFFDFTILCKDEETVKAHKMILAAQCKFFNGFFRSENKDTVNLPFNSQFVKICVDYLYTANVEVNEDNVQSILEVANYLEVQTLLKKCCSFLALQIDEENVIDISNLSVMVGSKILSDAIRKFVLWNIRFYSADKTNDVLLQLPKELLKDILKSEKLVLNTSHGNIVPGMFREVLVAEVIFKYLKTHPNVTFQYFIDCLKIWNIEEFWKVYEIYLKTSFEERDEDSMFTTEDKEQLGRHIIPSICRHLQGEDIVIFNPRDRTIVPTTYSSSSQTSERFDISCDNFDQNIVKIVVFSQDDSSHAYPEMMRGISVFFSDGTNKTVMTPSGVYNHTYTMQVPDHESGKIHFLFKYSTKNYILRTSYPFL